MLRPASHSEEEGLKPDQPEAGRGFFREGSSGPFCRAELTKTTGSCWTIGLRTLVIEETLTWSRAQRSGHSPALSRPRDRSNHFTSSRLASIVCKTGAMIRILTPKRACWEGGGFQPQLWGACPLSVSVTHPAHIISLKLHASPGVRSSLAPTQRRGSEA